MLRAAGSVVRQPAKLWSRLRHPDSSCRALLFPERPGDESGECRVVLPADSLPYGVTGAVERTVRAECWGIWKHPRMAARAFAPTRGRPTTQSGAKGKPLWLALLVAALW